MTGGFQIHTFGCKLNTYDSGRIEQDLCGLQSEKRRVHILNTCAVTSEATSTAIKCIRKLKSQDPECLVVVTGCGAQVETEKYVSADMVVANSHKGHLARILDDYFDSGKVERVHKSNIFLKKGFEEGGGEESAHTRSFLKIQDGCNSFCTFCIIPFARGRSRSLPVDRILERVNELADVGRKEVVLTGVHIGDYQDGDKGLEDLLSILVVKGRMPRIRLTSLEPVEISDRLLELFSDEKICPHFHMSIQSANSRVLAGMKRKYSAREVEESLQKIFRYFPEAFVGLDVIAGFPGEGDKEFADSFSRLKSLPWTRMHVFPYSERDGTKAVKLPGTVPLHIRKQRAKLLRQLSGERYEYLALRQIGRIKEVLILRSHKVGCRGISKDFWPVVLEKWQDSPASQFSEGRTVRLRVSGFDSGENSRMDGFLLSNGQ